MIPLVTLYYSAGQKNISNPYAAVHNFQQTMDNLLIITLWAHACTVFDVLPSDLSEEKQTLPVKEMVWDCQSLVWNVLRIRKRAEEFNQPVHAPIHTEANEI